MERVVRTALGAKIGQLATDDPDAARCPACARCRRRQGRVLTPPRDLPCGGSSRSCSGAKRRWRCWTPTARGGRSPSRSGRCRPGCARRPGCGGACGGGRGRPSPVRGRGSAPGVVADAAARGRGPGVVELVEPEPTTVLGTDETGSGVRAGCPTASTDDGRIRWTRTDPWETVFVDITGDQSLSGQVDGRTSAVVQAWFAARTAQFRPRSRWW